MKRGVVVSYCIDAGTRMKQEQRGPTYVWSCGMPVNTISNNINKLWSYVRMVVRHACKYHKQ